MYFTNGDHQAFESLMRDKPGDNYDSGADGPFPECRSCRCCHTQRKARHQNCRMFMIVHLYKKALEKACFLTKASLFQC